MKSRSAVMHNVCCRSGNVWKTANIFLTVLRSTTKTHVFHSVKAHCLNGGYPTDVPGRSCSWLPISSLISLSPPPLSAAIAVWVFTIRTQQAQAWRNSNSALVWLDDGGTHALSCSVEAALVHLFYKFVLNNCIKAFSQFCWVFPLTQPPLTYSGKYAMCVDTYMLV